jgi:hypothetical protein
LWKNFEIWTSYESCVVSCELHSISWIRPSPDSICFVRNLCCLCGRLEPHGSPTAEKCDRVEAFSSFSLGLCLKM